MTGWGAARRSSRTFTVVGAALPILTALLGVAIGALANGSSSGAALGGSAMGYWDGAAVGYGADGSSNGVAVGQFALGAGLGNVALGSTADAGSELGFTNTVELGPGTATDNGWLHFRGVPLFGPTGILRSNRIADGSISTNKLDAIDCGLVAP